MDRIDLRTKFREDLGGSLDYRRDTILYSKWLEGQIVNSKQMNDEEFEDRLVIEYNENCLAVGRICDNILDRSGALLGRIRAKSYKLTTGKDL